MKQFIAKHIKRLIPICSHIAVATALILVLNSCIKKDFGNYNRESISDIIFSDEMEDSYLVNLGDTFQLSASFANGETSKKNLTYSWYYFEDRQYNSDAPVIVGEEKDLKMELDMPTGMYQLILEVTDTETGIRGFKKMKLEVKRMTSEGWLLLTWDDVRAGLSIVSSEHEVFKDFMPITPDFPINQKPKSIYTLNDWDPKVQQIWINTAKDELFYLDYNDFKITNRGEDAFSSPPNTKMVHYNADPYFQTYFIWDAEDLIYRLSRPRGSVNFPEGFNTPLAGDYQAHKIFFPVPSMFPINAMFYDMKHKRFVYQEYAGNELKKFIETPAKQDFDLNNFNEKIIFGAEGSNDFSIMVSKDNQGHINLYNLDLNLIPDANPLVSKTPLIVPDNSIPTYFAASKNLPLIYYVAGQKLYLYKLSDQSTKLLYTFPTDEKIVTLQMLHKPMGGVTTPYMENRLAVATNKTSNGVFYTFDLAPTGNLKTGDYTFRSEDFSPIIDIAYKMKK